jgi:hypothetical protein
MGKQALPVWTELPRYAVAAEAGRSVERPCPAVPRPARFRRACGAGATVPGTVLVAVWRRDRLGWAPLFRVILPTLALLVPRAGPSLPAARRQALVPPGDPRRSGPPGELAGNGHAREGKGAVRCRPALTAA